ncbi:lytic transglycosylase domain-containing protein [Brevirhabdus sp.]|uniref:lytic transglycosylase domain-containing protein n=1 Tax=Brevirhabdus sp. TaxID=2004514 RepID=UPI004059E317
MPLDAVAESIGASSKARSKLFASQAALLDSRLSKQYSASSRLQPKSTKSTKTEPRAELGARAVPRYNGQYRGQYMPVARSAARRHGVPEDLFLRLVQQESNWNPKAVSRKGAIGLAQLMPATARILGVDPRSPRENLDGGAQYLRKQYDRFRNWSHALAAYNAGPGAVSKYGGIPPYSETRNYVRVIMGSP